MDRIQLDGDEVSYCPVRKRTRFRGKIYPNTTLSEFLFAYDKAKQAGPMKTPNTEYLAVRLDFVGVQSSLREYVKSGDGKNREKYR